MSQQETTWHQSLDEIQREIGSKLDKEEFSPLKEFVDNKLKSLQEKLKALSSMRQENEAAGTKKMLRFSYYSNLFIKKINNSLSDCEKNNTCIPIILKL